MKFTTRNEKLFHYVFFFFPKGINVEDEEGFFEEKDLSSFCDTFEGKLPTSNEHSKLPGYLNRLPEANPLLDVRI